MVLLDLNRLAMERHILRGIMDGYISKLVGCRLLSAHWVE